MKITPPSTQKKVFSTRIDENLIKDLKHLSVDTGRSMGDLLEEAIRLLLDKHKVRSKTT